MTPANSGTSRNRLSMVRPRFRLGFGSRIVTRPATSRTGNTWWMYRPAIESLSPNKQSNAEWLG